MTEKKINEEVIKDKMKDIGQEAVESVNEIYEHFKHALGQYGELIDKLSSGSLKRVLHYSAAYPAFNMDMNSLSTREKEAVDLSLLIRDYHIQLAFAAQFINPPKKESGNDE